MGDDLNIHLGVCSICQRSATSVDAHRDAANQVAHAHGQASPEEGISAKVVVSRVELLRVGHLGQLGGEDDGHDDAVDGDDFAEDDGDQILGSYPGRLDAATDNGHARGEDAPC